MRTFLGVLLLGVLSSGCQKEKPAEVRVDNTATRYTEGLITATEKAKISAEKANQAIAASQAAADKMAQEVQ
jgi:hypothetical protein